LVSGGGAAVAWINSDNGVSLANVTADGVVSDPVLVSDGSDDRFPRVVVTDTHRVVSWLDSYTGTLYFRRFSLELNGAEEPLSVAEGVLDESIGFAVDSLTDTGAFGLSFSSDRLKFAQVTCDG
jgi:hypothetical protein